ncbi:hypothetical protein ADEAN_000048600 [Angomonas deanei]|uniref:Uncharacterized protein n=1 Tax=Angomonas deanei TaxID=59799 RepID=A0A7G2C007_9TRYP|nr:hypothetical protein ADEAN_000048600 [Angomonas deanei]
MARVQYPTRKEDPYSSLNSSIALRSISSSLTQAIRVRKSTEEMRDSATRVSRSSPPPSTVSSAKPSEQSGSPLQRRRRAPYVTGSAGGNNFSVESDVEPLRPLSHKTTSVNVSLSSRTAGQETPEETVFDNLSYSSPPFGTVSYPQRESPADRRRVTAQGEVHTPRPGYAELTAQTFDVSDATVDASKSRISPGLAPTPKDSVNASIVPPPAELLPNTQSGEQDPYDENEEVFIIREVPSRETKTYTEPAPLSPSPTPPVEESPSIPHTRNSTTDTKTEQTNTTDTVAPSEVPLPSSMDPVPLRDSYDYGPQSASIDVDATPSRISYAGSMQSSISEVVGSENATRWVDDSWMSSVSRPGLQGTPQSVRRQLKVLEDALGNKDNESLEETVQRQQALIRDLMERLQSRANSRATSQGSSVYFNETMRSQRSTRSRSRRARLFDDTNATMESQMPISVMGSYVTNNSAQLAETDISSQENSTLSKLD